LHAFIIEDDHLIRLVIEDALSRLGFSQFSFARSEDAAIAGAQGETFDLITADVRLLPGDGIRAIEVLRKHRNVPVIFVTGYPEDVAGRMPGATIVRKPVKQDELASAVRSLVRDAASRS
jgi:DNA-binding response OmpR family regulator